MVMARSRLTSNEYPCEKKIKGCPGGQAQEAGDDPAGQPIGEKFNGGLPGKTFLHHG